MVIAISAVEISMNTVLVTAAAGVKPDWETSIRGTPRCADRVIPRAIPATIPRNAMAVDSNRPAAVTGNPLIASCMVETMRVVGNNMMIPPAMTLGGDTSTPTAEINRAPSVTTRALAAREKNSGIRHAPSFAVTDCTTTEETTATSAPAGLPPMASVMVPAAITVASHTTHLG